MSSLLLGLEGSITHSHLVKAAYEWVLKNGSCGVAFREFNTPACNGEYPDVIGFGSLSSVIIECKVSRADFFADRKKMFRKYPEQGMGKYRYYCTPTDLIKVDELPTGWGLIYVDANCRAKLKHKPMVTTTSEDGYELKRQYEFEFNREAEQQLMYSALRRLHIRGRIEEVYIGLKEWEADQKENNSQTE